MTHQQILKGFSKFSPEEKLRFVSRHFDDAQRARTIFASFIHPDPDIQQLLSSFSENSISNFPLPYGVAPNFMINGTIYLVPMVVEESSVVAAASAAARFWAERGGFRARVTDTSKNGQLHFLYQGDPGRLKQAMPAITDHLRKHAAPVTVNMEKRGGGIKQISLKDQRHLLENYFQLHATFETGEAMGANFINSCLEDFSEGLNEFLANNSGFDPGDFEPLMAILSNYNEECLVEISASCPVSELNGAAPGLTGEDFARRFALASQIAETDVHRATTHNKGIMNGVDAVILATGNDFRAIEAGAHAFAANSGTYRSLSRTQIKDDEFEFSLTMPMALGTVGGLTRLHPLAEKSMEMLGNPGARELMMIAAAAGLANNFAALRSLTTTGIQAGHMRLHLPNILSQLNASEEESQQAIRHFSNRKVSYQAVAAYLDQLRKP
ncbi:MAG: hydroxymethylglutaryl-CoA reductase, degradative [Bacteroidales bacterium]